MPDVSSPEIVFELEGLSRFVPESGKGSFPAVQFDPESGFEASIRLILGWPQLLDDSARLSP